MISAMKTHLNDLKFAAPRTVSKVDDQVCRIIVSYESCTYLERVLGLCILKHSRCMTI